MSITIDTDTLDELDKALDEIQTETQAVATVIAEDDVMADVTLDMLLSGHALLTGDAQARTFVKGKEVFRNEDVIRAERAARERERLRKRELRRRQALKRADRDNKRSSAALDPVRMKACLALLGNLTHVVASLTLSRYNKFRRVLGDVMVEDITSDSTIRIAEALARADIELITLAQAAIWLRTAPQPYVTADGPQGSGQLLGTMVTVIGRTIVDTYRNNTTVGWTEIVDENGERAWVQKDMTLTSFELLETVAHNNRTDVDDMLSHVKAGNHGKKKSTPPGMREKRQFARAVVDHAITARGLDWLANMLMDEDRTRTDGTFKWTENADTIWAGFGLPPMTTDSSRLKAAYARRAVALAFEFLPEVVRAAYEIIGDPTVMWHLDVHTSQEFIARASAYKASNTEHRFSNTGDSMDGGVSLAENVQLTDDLAGEDADKAKKALAAIYANEGWDF